MPTDLFAKGLPETLKRSLKEHRQQVSAILKQLAMKDTYNTLIPQHYYKIFFLST